MVLTVSGAGSLARTGQLLFAVSLTTLRGTAARRLLKFNAAESASHPSGEHHEALYEFIRYMTQVDLHREPGEQLAGFVRDAFAMEAVAIFDADLNKTYSVGEWFVDPENTLRNVHLFERSSADPETGLSAEVLRIGSLPIGAVLLRGEIDRAIAGSVANLIANTFDRYHSRANLTRTESARETERLRTTVLDSLAHAYKTPLTAIRAAATGVQEIGSLSHAQSELVSVIEEQTARLNDLTTQLLTTARLESGGLTLHNETFALAPLVDDVIASLQTEYPGVKVRVTVTPEDLNFCGDRHMIVALLTQYADNAAKYSHLGSLITVEVTQEDESLLLSVHNDGSVIPENEFDRIFDRYVRGADTAAEVSGTGIGLSIARAAAQAQGGDVWLTSTAATGTTFWASMPIRSKVNDIHG